MPVQFYHGSVLFKDGKVAMDPGCCCVGGGGGSGDCFQCDSDTNPTQALISVSQVQGVVCPPETNRCPDAGNLNGSYLVDLESMVVFGETIIECAEGLPYRDSWVVYSRIGQRMWDEVTETWYFVEGYRIPVRYHCRGVGMEGCEGDYADFNAVVVITGLMYRFCFDSTPDCTVVSPSATHGILVNVDLEFPDSNCMPGWDSVLGEGCSPPTGFASGQNYNSQPGPWSPCAPVLTQTIYFGGADPGMGFWCNTWQPSCSTFGMVVVSSVF